MKEKLLTIPNLLTFFRILLIPFIVFFLYQDRQPQLLIGLILYLVSALSDTLDGFLARKLNQESKLGAYLDPLADKILVNILFILFALKPSLHIGIWAFLIFLIRDIWITRLRNLAHKKNFQFKTSFFGKAKTVSQMLTITYVLVYMNASKFLDPALSYSRIWEKTFPSLRFLAFSPLILTLISIFFSLASGIAYGMNYQKLMKNKVQQ